MVGIPMFCLPNYIHIYNDSLTTQLDTHLLAGYLMEKTRLCVDIRGNLISTQKSLAEEFAKAKIIDLYKRELNFTPLPAEIEYEYKVIYSKKPSKLLYDGFYLQEIFYNLLPKNEHSLKHLHIIFTSRLFATFEDNRYHARVAVFGSPAIISTTGIVEAPAKPREFYIRKQLGEDIINLKEEFKGRFIDYNDDRLNEIMKGYVMQAYFYHILGNPFCDNQNCRLYNAHWQEEVIMAQLNKPEFCNTHEQLLQEGIGIK